jgi:hypothetical protein
MVLGALRGIPRTNELIVMQPDTSGSAHRS